MYQFREGHWYYGRFISDADTVVSILVTRHTPQTVVYWNPLSQEHRRRKIHAGIGKGSSEMIVDGPGLSIMAKSDLGPDQSETTRR